MPKVAAEKKVYEATGKTIAELAKEFKHAKAQKKFHEAEMEAWGSLVHTISTKLLPRLMEDMEGDGINVTDVGYVELGTEVYPSVKVADQEEWYQWLRDNDLGDIIKETIHHKTLQSTVSEQLDNGVKFPDYVNIALVPTAVLKAEKKSSRKGK